ILARVEVEITCTDSFAKAVCLAASTIAERASDFFFHAGLPTVMGEASIIFHFMEQAETIGIILKGQVDSIKPFPNGKE
ncbi:MAG: hypothetical protein PUB60_01795, partial [Veillonellaceae bacterium]|nr:hypothetical protein [Veillonellaceae bacterium]